MDRTDATVFCESPNIDDVGFATVSTIALVVVVAAARGTVAAAAATTTGAEAEVDEVFCFDDRTAGLVGPNLRVSFDESDFLEVDVLSANFSIDVEGSVVLLELVLTVVDAVSPRDSAAIVAAADAAIVPSTAIEAN